MGKEDITGCGLHGYSHVVMYGVYDFKWGKKIYLVVVCMGTVML